MNHNSKIYVAGHRGLVGSALVRELKQQGFERLLLRTHEELDLTSASETKAFFSAERPDIVFLAAAKVGGIHANSTIPAEFIYQNLAIQLNVIHMAWASGVKRLLFMGSSCIYPRECPQPIKEDYLLTSPLEPTNSPYAVAKIAGIEMCDAYNRQYGTRFFAVMPTNLYGEGDNYDIESSHVLPAMLRKFHLAKMACERNWAAIEKDEAIYGVIPQTLREYLRALCLEGTKGQDERVSVHLWGSGKPRREFLLNDEMAEACVQLMRLPDVELDASLMRAGKPLVNIGCGKDLTIAELAKEVRDVVGFSGQIHFDTSMPDGTPQKLLDVSRIQRLGWSSRISLKEGLHRTYAAYLARQ